MRKLLLFTILSMVVLMPSCKKDKVTEDKEEVSSVINVKVTQKGAVQKGVTVCMFSEAHRPGTTFFKYFHAKNRVVTNSDGIASFDLRKIYDLDVIDNQTTFYFGVFDKDDNILGHSSVTIKKGQTKQTEISLKSTFVPAPAPVDKEATITVTATGANSFEGVAIKMAETTFDASSVVILDEKPVNDSKVSFDVKKYIGKTLYFMAYDKNGERIAKTVSKQITEGANAISIAVTPKDYTAKIKVVSGTTLQAGQMVYVLDPLTGVTALKAMSLLGYANLKAQIENIVKAKAQSDAKGIATFENLKPQFSNQSKMSFIVLIPTAPYYKMIELDMNGTAQSGTIDIYVEKAVVQPPVEKGTLTLKCTSSNPYRVVITDNKTDKILLDKEMAGKTVESYKLSYNQSVTIKVTQVSGYAFYPTKKEYQVTLTKSKPNKTVSFPN